MSSFLADLFGRSPVAPLQKHMDRVCACAEELSPLFQALIADDWDSVRKHRKTIKLLEDEADDLKREIRMNMPKSLFMPVPRADILDLLQVQDHIANRAKDITGLVIGRKMRLPEAFAGPYLSFVERCVDAARQARTTVGELDELYETGFRGAEVEIVQTMIAELDSIEKDTDRQQVELRAVLFGMEKDLPPVDVMFYYKITELTGGLADIAQRVGARLQLLLAR